MVSGAVPLTLITTLMSRRTTVFCPSVVGLHPRRMIDLIKLIQKVFLDFLYTLRHDEKVLYRGYGFLLCYVHVL
jgi:hypothetical protein